MNPFTVLAASYLGPEGYGNDRTGLFPWPGPLADALRQGEWEALRWSSLFTSETSRFGRMDFLSRLGLMAVELLDAGFASLAPAQRDRVGVCAESRSGSVATDVRFLQMPLASTFAYTIPSTVVGEICIRHRFRGPVMCLLPGPGQGGSLEMAQGWLARGEADACLCVGCDHLDKEVAPWLPLPHHLSSGGWMGCAALVGKRPAHGRECRWPPDPLETVARSLCFNRTGSI
jgi:3-oxoacyl-(acyl-carrier-protein) synthase